MEEHLKALEGVVARLETLTGAKQEVSSSKVMMVMLVMIGGRGGGDRGGGGGGGWQEVCGCRKLKSGKCKENL